MIRNVCFFGWPEGECVNLNFRIHVYNSKNHCEKLLRNDNDVLVIKAMASKTMFEIDKVDKHFFKYEFLNNPSGYFNNVNVLKEIKEFRSILERMITKMFDVRNK